MTTFSLIEGTAPATGRLARFMRKLSRSPNDPLATFIIRDDLIGLAKKMGESEFDLNDPLIFTKNVNSSWNLWRTPLELAADCGSSVEMVIFLLEKGAKITPPSLKLAIDGVLVDPSLVPVYAPYNFANAEKIVEMFSAAGADWSQAFYPCLSVYGRPSSTPKDVVETLGAVRAEEMGITSACFPREEVVAFMGPDDFVSQKQAEALQGNTPESTGRTPGKRI